MTAKIKIMFGDSKKAYDNKREISNNYFFIIFKEYTSFSLNENIFLSAHSQSVLFETGSKCSFMFYLLHSFYNEQKPRKLMNG